MIVIYGNARVCIKMKDINSVCVVWFATIKTTFWKDSSEQKWISELKTEKKKPVNWLNKL